MRIVFTFFQCSHNVVIEKPNVNMQEHERSILSRIAASIDPAATPPHPPPPRLWVEPGTVKVPFGAAQPSPFAARLVD